MRVLVCGSTGCVGQAVVAALRSREHVVIEAARSRIDGHRSMTLDFMRPCPPADWARRLVAWRVDAIVNCAGILMPSRGQRFERVHTAGPIELFRGAARAGVKRIVQISALGVSDDAGSLATPYLHSKLLADEALAALPIEWAVLRPSLVYGPHSRSAALFATLASLPVIALPGRGRQQVQPIHVYELAEIVAGLLEQAAPPNAVHALGGAERLSYRDMLLRYRAALRLGTALWLPLPLWMMKLGARAAEALPQRVFCRDTLRLLERGSVPAFNAAPMLLGRAPSSMAQGLAVTPPQPLLDLRAELSPLLAGSLRAALAFLWIYTAAISALFQHESGVMHLLSRCGFTGSAAIAALVASCTLNLLLGTLTAWRPSPALYALQCAAILGYTGAAALNMPELTLDHCGPLVKNLPVGMAVLVLWLAHRPEPSHAQGFMNPRLRTLTSKFDRFGKMPASCVSDTPNQRPSVAPN